LIYRVQLNARNHSIKTYHPYANGVHRIGVDEPRTVCSPARSSFNRVAGPARGRQLRLKARRIGLSFVPVRVRSRDRASWCSSTIFDAFDTPSRGGRAPVGVASIAHSPALPPAAAIWRWSDRRSNAHVYRPHAGQTTPRELCRT
jgi:hypothetical protein